jgi:beta-galactosidase
MKSETAHSGRIPVRQTLDLQRDWRFFHPGKALIPFDAMMPSFDDSEWRIVELPHDWGVEGSFDPNAPGGHRTGFLPTGEGAYRREIRVETDWLEGRVLLCFDGVFRHSDVFVNGRHIGHRANGWVAFQYDITDTLQPGRNLIAVRVDNRRQPAARWYTGSGINRPVRLLRVPATWLDADRIDVKQSHREESVLLDIGVDIHGPLAGDGWRVEHRLVGPDGESVGGVGGDPGSRLQLPVAAPRRWSPTHPSLYLLRTRLLRNGSEMDAIETRLGLRHIELDAKRGFVLNGERIKLKGFCIREDHGPLGTALPDKAWRSKLSQLKAIGCNAIRCGHHPFSRIFYHLCDELGFLVMDEFCDGWDRAKAAEDYGRDWFANWHRDLEDTLRLHRNHPSIVFWSIGNEVHQQTDEKTQLLVETVKAIDTSRPVVMGRGYADCLDATCFNGQAEKPGVLETFHRANPDRPVVLTEAPHSYTTRGVYRTRSWLRDPGAPHFDVPNLTGEELFFYDSSRNHSSYDNATIRIGIRECWKRTQGFDFVAGQFHWTYWDYAGEGEYHGTSIEGEPDGRFWSRGVVDMAMIRKDHSYYYESQFSARPMIHLLPHWTHPQLEAGTPVPVWAYTNGDCAELFLNGTSLGKQSVPPCANAAWDVPWHPGTIEAVAYRDGREVARDRNATAGHPQTLALIPDDLELEEDLDDFTRVEIQARDAAGNPVPWCANPVALHVEGPHRFLGTENGDRLDFTAPRATCRRLYFGKMAAFIGATDQPGDIVVTAAALLTERYFTGSTRNGTNLSLVSDAACSVGRVGQSGNRPPSADTADSTELNLAPFGSTRVTLAIKRLALRGSIREQALCAVYTLDGSDPGVDSPVWEGDLVLDRPARLRVAVHCEGRRLLALEEQIRLGPAPIQGIPPGHNPDEDLGVDGVRDPEAMGLWKSQTDGGLFRFEADGNVIEVLANGIESRVARWWYDYPNDRDEDPDDHGTGEWVGSRAARIPLALTSRSAQEMIVGTGNAARRLRKVGPASLPSKNPI